MLINYEGTANLYGFWRDYRRERGSVGRNSL